MNNDQTTQLQENVLAAIENSTALDIQGLGSKRFYGRKTKGKALELDQHTGIISYEPSELVITVRSGTPLTDIINTLHQQQQMLAFEPPLFNGTGSIGGAIASGLSGPRRPYTGAARDFLLGVSCLNGKAELLSFGGQVMKNVAGYDVSRLMCGAMGTLGVLLEVSLKVLPLPEHEITLVRSCNKDEALNLIRNLPGKNPPLSGACFYDGELRLRLSGTETAVLSASADIGGDEHLCAEDFWSSLRDQTHSFFNNASRLWRLSLPPATPALKIDGEEFIDWGGAQRWLKSDADNDTIRQICDAHNGHATLFHHDEHDSDVFHPLSPGVAHLHRQLKQSFDPHAILNPKRMTAEW